MRTVISVSGTAGRRLSPAHQHALAQCRVGDSFKMNQHWGELIHHLGHPANTRHFPDVVLMLGRRRRRRTNIKTTLGKCFVCYGYDVQVYPLVSEAAAGPPLSKHKTFE